MSPKRHRTDSRPEHLPSSEGGLLPAEACASSLTSACHSSSRQRSHTFREASSRQSHSFKSCSRKGSRPSQRAASGRPPGARGPSAPAPGPPHPGFCSGPPAHGAGAVFPLRTVHPICSEQESAVPPLEWTPEGVGPLSGSGPLCVTPSPRSQVPPTHRARVASLSSTRAS